MICAQRRLEPDGGELNEIGVLGFGGYGLSDGGSFGKRGISCGCLQPVTEKAGRWAGSYDGTACDSIGEAVRGAEIVMACVGDDNDVRQVCLAAFDAMDPGTLFVDHTTASALVAREMASAGAEKSIGFIDAPVSGGQAGAETGQLTIMCGGTQHDYQRAELVMQAYAKAITHMGEVGAGQATKMVNQVAIAGLVQGLSEALALGRSQGLDMKKALGAISQGAAGSWQMSNRGETMLDDSFDFGFAVDWMRKDLAICLAAAQEAGLDLSITKIVDGYYAEVQDMGGGRWDTSSLIKRLP